jgi:2-keto-4-pentenoate hydratase/2-oxohepta-3-ene-1,7-dioic acid hydratase in catechol pathway
MRVVFPWVAGVCALAASTSGARASGDAVTVATPAEALTFARVAGTDGPRVLLVLRYDNGTVEAIDLSIALGTPVRDPIDAYREHGRATLLAIASQADPPARVVVPATALTIPVELGSHHVAAGTNYPEHAGEAGVEDGPFLFAKLVAPTAPRSRIPVGSALLDYEVELAWVTLEDRHNGTAPAEMGVILCNDYTDRETLLEHIDVWNVASGAGFTTGKSSPGYLPVGDLFVIPRDYRSFAATRELALDVNGAPRQRSLVSAQVWNIDSLLSEIWKRREQRWEHRGNQVGLLPDGEILPARTLILSGTPSGTVFQDIGLAHKARGMASWAFGGWREPIAAHVIGSYVRDPAVRARYLQPGDRVTIRVDGLGVIDNEIIP